MRTKLIIAALVLAAAVFWMLRGGSGAADSHEVRASIRASRAWIGPFGRVQLEVTVQDEDGRKLDRARYEYEWHSSAGVVSGKGADAEWIAPSARGTHRVSVSVRDRRGGAPVATSIGIDVRNYRGMDGEQPETAATDDGEQIDEYTIGEVVFDKSKLCANDDVRVSVRATDPSGRSDWVMPIVRFPGRQVSGFETIGRAGREFVEANESAGGIEVVLIDTRTRRPVAAKKVPFAIEPCEASHAGLDVRCRTSGGRPDELFCEASAALAGGFAPVRYEWQIEGEDEVISSNQPWFRRVLPTRTQTGAVQTYVVRAQAFDAAGSWIEGRASHLLRNAYWETAQMTGLLQLQVQFGRVLRDGDDAVAPVRITNPFDEPVRLDTIRVERFTCAEGDSSPATSAEPPVSAERELGSAVLQPGATLSYDWRLPADPNRCDARATLTGEGVESGLPAEGVWRMPTNPQAREPLAGTELDRVRKAMRILSQRRGVRVSSISKIEMDDLVREGLLPEAEAQPQRTDREAGASW